MRTVVVFLRMEWIHPMAFPPSVKTCQQSELPVEFGATLLGDAMYALALAINELRRKVLAT